MNLFNFGSAQNDRVAARAVQSGVVEDPPEGCLWHLNCAFPIQEISGNTRHLSLQVDFFLSHRYLLVGMVLQQQFFQVFDGREVFALPVPANSNHIGVLMHNIAFFTFHDRHQPSNLQPH